MVDREMRLNVEVVLVCDAVDSQDDSSFAFSHDGDRPTGESLAMIYQGLSQAVAKVTHYDRLDALIDNISRHKDAIVFPYWFGRLSRNRHSLVPAICEAYDLCYIGADAYSKVVCNDKYLSKLLCRVAGFATPAAFLVTNEDDLDLLDNCDYPRVVKPNWQGSSLGIEEESLVKSSSDARAVAQKIARSFGWPVLCEEFITGREVSITVMGSHQIAPIVTALSWAVGDDQGFFDRRLFTYSLKYLAGLKFSPIILDDLADELRDQSERMFRLLDKAEILRIDGRLTEEGFSVLELSPDLDLRPDGEAAISFTSRSGSSYPVFLRELLTNALERAGRQPPMDDES